MITNIIDIVCSYTNTNKFEKLKLSEISNWKIYLRYKNDEWYNILFASKNGYLTLFKYFCFSEKKINKGVMSCACVYGHLNIVKYLHNINRSRFTTFALVKAIENDHYEIVEFLHKIGLILPDNDSGVYLSKIRYLSETNNLVALKQVYNSKYNSKYTKKYKCGFIFYELLKAIKNGFFEMAEFISTTGIIIQDHDIQLVIDDKNIDTLKFLDHLDLNIDYTIQHMNKATKLGCLDIVIFLYNVKNIQPDETTMQIASTHGYLEIVKFLHNTNVIPITLSAMDCAISSKHFFIVKYLHHRGYKWSINALHNICQTGNLSIIKYLHNMT